MKKNFFSLENLGNLALAAGAFFAGLWWVFTVSQTASDAKAMTLQQAPVIEQIDIRTIKMEKDIEFIKENLKNMRREK